MSEATREGHRPGRLGVGIVGAGRVGAVLGSALRAAGHAVVGASAVSEESRDRIEVLLPGVPVLSVEEVVERAELVLLTVPDDVLPDLVAGMAELGHWQAGQIVLHTSGRFGADVLAPARRAGAIPLAIHPAMTFTGTSVDLSRLVGCPFAVSAPGPVLPIAQALVVEIGGEPVVLPEAVRPLYHAALAHGANHLVTLVTQATRVLQAAGVEEPGQMLTPLLTAALEGALRQGEAHLTGPVVRGDVGTVRDHVAALAALAAEDPAQADVPETYRALARVTTQRAVTAGRLREAPAQALLDLLASPAGPGGAALPVAAPAHPAPVADTPTDPVLVRTREELVGALRGQVGRRAVVMTMGALHEGHLDLVRAARERAEHVVVTIFVNPLQFAPGEDFEAYPRDLAGDLARLAEVGADVVFAPEPAEVYPQGDPVVQLDPGPMGAVLEGRTRPTHFAGVLTVVNKLLHLVRPDVALFGEKDAQQLALVRAMVRDLDMGVEVVGVPIRRDADGLALSSRNAYLSADERRSALALSAALRAGAAAGAGGPAEVLAAAAAVLDAAPGVRLDYLALVDPDTLAVLDDDAQGAGLLAVAAWVGNTRLIDNVAVTLGVPPQSVPGETDQP
ncbi:pantoate--beta-alanine ligase [Georgenia faecalis]|uniref:Pantothenate synthetase n=1 Tax=Georgenia faecalis TaxID=2483799 RepID=A0ABV9DE15_9MICO